MAAKVSIKKETDITRVSPCHRLISSATPKQSIASTKMLNNNDQVGWIAMD